MQQNYMSSGGQNAQADDGGTAGKVAAGATCEAGEELDVEAGPGEAGGEGGTSASVTSMRRLAGRARAGGCPAGAGTGAGAAAVTA